MTLGQVKVEDKSNEITAAGTVGAPNDDIRDIFHVAEEYGFEGVSP